MLAALTYLGASVGIFLLITLLFVVEDSKGDRIVLKGIRRLFDSLLLLMLGGCRRVVKFFTHGFMRLLLHYSAHRLLNRLLHTLQRLEGKVENLVRHNRKVAKTIKEESKEKTHLQAIAEHKEEVSLSDAQKEQLKTH